MTAPLSPAAQAAWDAFNDVADRVGVFEDYGNALAAAIRAVADVVVPEEASIRRGVRPGGNGSITPDEFQLDQRSVTRRKILAIAAELEGRDA